MVEATRAQLNQNSSTSERFCDHRGRVLDTSVIHMYFFLFSNQNKQVQNNYCIMLHHSVCNTLFLLSNILSLIYRSVKICCLPPVNQQKLHICVGVKTKKNAWLSQMMVGLVSVYCILSQFIYKTNNEEKSLS